MCPHEVLFAWLPQVWRGFCNNAPNSTFPNCKDSTLSNCQPHIASILPKCYQSHIVKLSTPHCKHFTKMLPIPHCQIVNPTLQSFCQNATNPTLSNHQLHIAIILPKCYQSHIVKFLTPHLTTFCHLTSHLTTFCQNARNCTFPTCQLHVDCAMLPTPHWSTPNFTLPNPQLQLPVFCWNAPNSTFSNYQLHSARATFSICQIAPSKYLIYLPNA
jgi:hypothetical protein